MSVLKELEGLLRDHGYLHEGESIPVVLKDEIDRIESNIGFYHTRLVNPLLLSLILTHISARPQIMRMAIAELGWHLCNAKWPDTSTCKNGFPKCG